MRAFSKQWRQVFERVIVIRLLSVLRLLSLLRVIQNFLWSLTLEFDSTRDQVLNEGLDYITRVAHVRCRILQLGEGHFMRLVAPSPN